MILGFTKYIEKSISKHVFLTKLYNLYYKSTVSSEIEAANINKNDYILCIGGGAVPSTALILAKKTQAYIDIIDIDREAIIKSEKLIRNIGLDKQIKVRQLDGTKIDASNYDIVHIASQVCNKEKVIRNVIKRVKCGTKILIRQPQSGLRNFYSQFPKSCLEGCRFKNNTCQDKFRFNTMKGTMVLIKTK